MEGSDPHLEMEGFDPHLEMEGFDRLLRFARRLRPRRPVWPASDRSLPGSSPDFRTDARALTGSHPSHIQDSKKGLIGQKALVKTAVIVEI